MQEYIEIEGARENNLKDVSLRIPKRQITIFTGVSGSGKSSIVFDTIATEAQRLLTENFSMFLRNFMPRWPQPDADSIKNLSMAVVVDQKKMGGGSTSTVGTITDIAPVLRMLFSRVGKPHVGFSNAFSFNDPAGMCLECNGVGRKMTVLTDTFLDMDKSLNEGAVTVPFWSNWEKTAYTSSGFFDNDKKLRDFTNEEMDLLLHGKDRKFKIDIGGGSMNATYLGIVEKIERSYVRRDIKTLSERTQKMVAPYIGMGPCGSCNGARLNKAALSCRIDGRNIADFSSMQIDELIEVLKGVKEPEAGTAIQTLLERLGHLADIGLPYLTLDRPTDTLSGGESQRVKVVKHLTSSLVDIMYIFDEPSVGLHPRDVHRMNDLLQRLRDKGNTVIVVEHDPDVIKVADHIVDVGPHAGSKGGKIMYEGTYKGLLESDTLTGNHLKQNLPLKVDVRTATGQLPIKHAKTNNLQDVSVDIPMGVLTVVTGVAGSGKSSLINQEFLRQHPNAIVVDQSPVGVSTRSNPATYTGIMDEVRKAFAAANKVNAGLFSFNSKGACEKCQGLGVLYQDMGFLEGVKIPCDVCEGHRFKDEVLAYKLGGKSVAEVLNMRISEALEFFEGQKMPTVVKILRAMSDVGLDYLTLGQPLSTLSGGECQRIKLAGQLHKKGSVYVMDEPTTGLHRSDTRHLVEIMNRLVDEGNTVVVIEHNTDIMRNADWIIDMGPEGGNRGGKVLFEGAPSELKSSKISLTAQYI
jgi:excinuclease UvrABC ATPase subunit